MITKTAYAYWEGNLKEGEGHVSTESKAMDHVPYGFNTRFEDKAGTNPEELLGAAHAGCFSMALLMILGEENVVAEYIKTQADVSLEKQDDGFAIPKIHLNVEVKAPDSNEGVVKSCAHKAKEGCPVSKVLNADITMDVVYKS